MTNLDLAESYLFKATKRLKILDIFMVEKEIYQQKSIH